MLKRYKLTPQSLTTIVVILVIIIGVPLLAWHTRTRKQSITTTPRLVLSDPDKGQFYIASENGKQLNKYDSTKGSLLRWLASNVNGDILISQGAGTAGSNTLIVENGKLQHLSPAADQTLSKALSGSGIYFIDQNSVLAVTCPDAKTNCTLDSINLVNGSKVTLLNLGIKQTTPPFLPVNLMGYSADSKTAYLWVDGQNKLGQLSNGIYQIDTSAKKVTASYSVPAESAFSASLSPDYQTLAYQQVLAAGKDAIHLLNLASGKDKKVVYNLDGLPDSGISWSPDGSKLLIQSQAILLPASMSASPSPIKSVLVNAYSGKAQQIYQIADSRYGQLVYQGWLDNGNVVYQTKKTSDANNFNSAVAVTAVLNISSQKSQNLKVPAGSLIQVFQQAN